MPSLAKYWNLCCGSWSGIRCFLTPGSGIRNRFFQDFGTRIPEPGSWIPNPYFWELSDNFWSKKFYNSLKIGSIFFLEHFKNKTIFNYVKFVATKKGMTTNFFSSLSFASVLDLGSGIRDPGWVKIRIRDPGCLSRIRHWLKQILEYRYYRYGNFMR